MNSENEHIGTAFPFKWGPSRIVLADHQFTCQDSVDGCKEESSS